ncbi:MAG: T9SS type A sorting domain-containing protein [Bacteroidales bacterium]|nr:T9SS type A sorting domain-containing protein [Bacteroidales bacterium]
MKHNYYFKLFLIAIALFASQSVWAQWSGNGTQANPYKINDTGDWNTLCDKVYNGNTYSGKYFELTNDITVSRCIGANHNRKPKIIDSKGVTTYFFKGHFNGAGHTITLTNLHSLDNIDKDKNKYIAPFRYVEDATIENLHVTGTITASDKYAGGIVGNGEDCNIKSCRSSVNIISSVNGDGSHGGLVGYAIDDVTITDCLFDGSLEGPNTKCWGGFTGWAKSKNLSITRCLFNPTGVNVKDNGNKTFYRSDSSPSASVHYYKRVLGTAQGYDASGMSNADLRSALGGNWEIIDEEVTPGEVVIYRVVPILHTSIAPLGKGTEEEPYIIASDGNWNYISNQVNGGAKTYSGEFLALTSDINVNTMIGEDETKSFRGTFDGRGHTITFSYTSKNHKCGPFRIINGATIKNLHTTGTIYTSKKNAAGLVGKSFGTCTIERCRSSITINSSVDGDGTDGGFIGEIETGNVTINHCLFDGKFIGTKTEDCGGFIGWVDDDTKATIKNSLFNPAELTTDPDGNKTFARAEQSEDLTLDNCYYKATFGEAQGTYVSTMTTNELVTALGSTYWQNVADAALPKMNFQVTQFTGSGTEESPYIIASTANWNYLMEQVNGRNSYIGEYFRLDADVDISTMVGCTLDEKHPSYETNTYFSGTFDGNGHTLNINLVGTGSDWVAPFLALEDATIKNLNLTGTVTTNRMRPASITSFVQGTVNILNCSSSVNIISNYNSDIDAGAFVARVNTEQTLNMTGCVFTGKIIYSDSEGYEGGGLVGFTQYQAHANLKDCLFAPSEFTVTKIVYTGDSQYYHYMLVGGYGIKNFDNCYYNSVAASLISKHLQVQGKRGRSIIPNRFTTVENTGTATAYNVSGLTSYGTNHGILYADTLRAGNADGLSLTLTYTGGDKYGHDGTFSASSGTLSGSSNPFSLTMADNNCIITAIISFNTFNNDGDWNVASNWSLGVVPTDCDVAIAKAATIPSGCTAIVDSIDMKSRASIIISDGGQLVANNAITAQVQKTIEASTYQGENKWYLIASPVNGQTFAGVTGLTSGTHNIYRYDEPTNMWQEYRNESNQFSSFENGRGYLFRTTNSGAITFNGTLNNAPVRYDLSYTEGAGDLKGFNIIGNPFSHNIYKGSAEGNAIANDYLEEKYCVLNTNGTWTITNDNVAIAPGQGILVQAKPEAGSLDITNSMVGPVGKADNDNIWFTVKNSEFMDKACVEFRDGHGFNKPTHYNADAPMFYVRYDDEDFASVCMPDDTEVIDLRFESKNISQYTLSVNANGDFSYLHLIDKVAGADVDMLANDSYTFVGSSTDDKDRFEVVLRYNADPASTPTETFAYQNGNDIIVTGEGELQVFDIMGRMVMTQHVNGVQTVEKPSLYGVYIFKLNEKTQKIVVR